MSQKNLKNSIKPLEWGCEVALKSYLFQASRMGGRVTDGVKLTPSHDFFDKTQTSFAQFSTTFQTET